MTIERDISLEDAVQKASPLRFATWITSGNIFENTLAESICTSRISVSWTSGKVGYAVSFGIYQCDRNSSITDFGTFSSLEKVKENFPNLFEVFGTLRVY